MIAYKDFAPQASSPGSMLKRSEFESFAAAVAEANRWIGSANVRVTNVETVVLPNIWLNHEEGTTDASLTTAPDWATSWHQFVRVWYEKS